MKPTMDPVKLAAKEPLVPGPSPGPSWGRETAVNSGQSRCPADNDIGRSTAVIGRDGAAGPYMACKGSGVQIPSAPPQVRGPVRLRPLLNRPPRAADGQQSVLPGRSGRPTRLKAVAVVARVAWGLPVARSFLMVSQPVARRWRRFLRCSRCSRDGRECRPDVRVRIPPAARRTPCAPRTRPPQAPQRVSSPGDADAVAGPVASTRVLQEVMGSGRDADTEQ
jgi:hypothetical protein